MLDNAAIADLLIREAADAEGHRGMALRRAAHSAFMWPLEAEAMLADGHPLTELAGIGPSLAKRIAHWIDTQPTVEIPPLRREFLTLAKARRVLAKNPEWVRQLKGDLQMHTTWSDGAGSIAEMATAAIARGYQYIGITDHTKGLKIAGGIDESSLGRQGREIAKINQGYRKLGIDFTVLRSAEVNLSPDGGGDMDPAALGELDLVLGCFHSALRRKEDQTSRYIAGLRNPDIQILGHPQTRVWNYRAGLHADWSAVFAEAAKLGKAVEIDGYADRQDLRVSLLKIARKEGTRISLGTDAHRPEQLQFMELGLAAALLGKIPAERIINFLPLEDLRAWVESARKPQSIRRAPRRRIARSVTIDRISDSRSKK